MNRCWGLKSGCSGDALGRADGLSQQRAARPCHLLQVRTRDPFSSEFYVLSDELNPKALKARDAYNNIASADDSAFDTLLTGRCAGRAAGGGRGGPGGACTPGAWP
jgi:hypothetical protein